MGLATSGRPIAPLVPGTRDGGTTTEALPGLGLRPLGAFLGQPRAVWLVHYNLDSLHLSCFVGVTARGRPICPGIPNTFHGLARTYKHEHNVKKQKRGKRVVKFIETSEQRR